MNLKRTARCVATWAAGSAAFGTALLGFGLSRPDLWVVTDVRFSGAVRASPAALRHLMDLPNGASWWTVDERRVEAKLRRHPWVKDAAVDAAWNGRVTVQIEEFLPVALVRYDAGLYYVAADGTVFLRARSDDLDYPVLSGLDHPLLGAHPDLRRLTVRDALWLIRALDARGLADRGDIASVDFSPTRGFTVGLDQAELVFGIEGLPDRLQRLEALVANGVDLASPVTVDLGPERAAIVEPRAAHVEPKAAAGIEGSHFEG